MIVRLDGRRVEKELPGRQGRTTLAYLVVNRLRPVTRDELIEALWPAEPPPAAAGALSALLSKLRRTLGDGTLAGRADPRLVLPADAWVDLEAAREAIHRAESSVARGAWASAWGPARVSLHVARRGFLPGEDLPWVDEQRRALGEIELRALECIAESSLGLGASERDAAVRSGRDLVRLAPHRESGHRLLMRALAAEGNAAEALGVYEALRVRLRDDLGAAPGPDTQALHRQLLG
jgi:DNA-binding SARP family transcriptional activator